ncbi:hypothetical protein [Haloferula luteola]|nr:hypothetical protein [Haloferula luteola]
MQQSGQRLRHEGRVACSSTFAEELMHSTQQDYRLIPDQRVKVAEYRFYWIVGKALVVLMLALSTPMVFGINQDSGFALWWLFAIPVILLVALFWGSFPAFCRCPVCKKRMVSRSMAGNVIKSHRLFDEMGPKRHYLVCDRCKLYLFLGESEAG